MTYFLGIDGGGTQTRCVVGDCTDVLARATSDGSNVVRVGATRAAQAIRNSILDACRNAAVDPSEVACTCIGTAGLSAPNVSEQVHRFIANVVPGKVIVCGDNEIAMTAAFGDGPGVVVASGTGSIAYGRNETGETARAGGYGFAISDEGSGHWVGRMAVSAMMRAHDRRQQTLLTPYILEKWQVQTQADVVKRANATPDFAALFPEVLRAAQAGDQVAIELLELSGRELATLAMLVIRQLWSAPVDVPVATIGGVFASSDIVRQHFREGLLKECAALKIEATVPDPVLGALAIARKQWGESVSQNSLAVTSQWEEVR